MIRKFSQPGVDTMPTDTLPDAFPKLPQGWRLMSITKRQYSGSVDMYRMDARRGEGEGLIGYAPTMPLAIAEIVRKIEAAE